jgi:cytochrome c-type biogenesis protein CcmH
LFCISEKMPVRATASNNKSSLRYSKRELTNRSCGDQICATAHFPLDFQTHGMVYSGTQHKRQRVPLSSIERRHSPRLHSADFPFINQETLSESKESPLMIVFWTFAALLATGALWFALRPRSHVHSAARKLELIGVLKQQLSELDAGLANRTLAPEQYEENRLKLERRLLSEGGVASWATGARRLFLPVTGVLLVTLVAVGSYYFLADKPWGAKTPAAADAGQMKADVDNLAARLQDHPKDVDGWAMLGRSYSALQRFDESVAAFAKADALQPGNAQLLADYADAAAMTQGKRFDGKPAELIQRALQADPNNMKALTLAGSAAFDAGAYDQATGFWQQLLLQVEPTSEAAATFRANIADAQRRANKSTPAQMARESAHASATVKGRVRLIAELAANAAPTDTVFVFARSIDAPTVPLAVLKFQVKDLPLDFTLDDTMALNPGVKLSKFKAVDVGARISNSGSVTTRHGDLVSQIVRTTVGGPAVELPIQGLVR